MGYNEFSSSGKAVKIVKLHLFRGFENERLGISRHTPLGHLYSDESCAELLDAGTLVGLCYRHLQNSKGFYHFDLWGEPLEKARRTYRIVSNREIYHDLQRVRPH